MIKLTDSYVQQANKQWAKDGASSDLKWFYRCIFRLCGSYKVLTSPCFIFSEINRFVRDYSLRVTVISDWIDHLWYKLKFKVYYSNIR
jgi:hypothetical protein